MATVHQVGGVPQTKTLRVLPRGTALVPNYEANPGKTFTVRAFHGWRHDASMGGEVLEPVRTTWEPSGKRQGAFVRVADEVTTVPDTAEYRRHLRGDERHSRTEARPDGSTWTVPAWNGDLWPADEETAQAVGIAFDPTFGGLDDESEHPALSKKFAADPKHARLFARLRAKPDDTKAGTRVPTSPPTAPETPAAKETAK